MKNPWMPATDERPTKFGFFEAISSELPSCPVKTPQTQVIDRMNIFGGKFEIFGIFAGF